MTNQFVQKKHPEYKEKKDDSVMTMEAFNEFINASGMYDEGKSLNDAKGGRILRHLKIMPVLTLIASN